MGFPSDFFPVLFAIPRIAGWLAHWKESMEEPDGKIWRPRQIYEGHALRSFIPIERRYTSSSSKREEEEDEVKILTSITSHPFSKRRNVSVAKL